jgi:hypothetical protein
MTKEELFNLVKPIWVEDLRLRQQRHVVTMRTVDATCVANGILRSGSRVNMAHDASVNELRVRARLGRNTLRKAVNQTKTRWVATDLRSIYLDLVTDFSGDIVKAMETLLHQMSVMNHDQLNSQMRALGDEQVSAIDREIAELALFAAAPDPMAHSSTTGIVVQGHVYGAVQSGEASTARVTINLDSTNAAALREAVQALRALWRSTPPPDLPQYADAVLADLEAEASKTHPEPKRIVALLAGGASIVETLANVPGAWETVKVAAHSMGFGF